jgi:cytochrome P450/deferrochelatase/peroxidase EfeB
MAFFKWFHKIEALQAADRARPPGPLEPFDFSSLKPKTVGARVKAAVITFFFNRVVPPLLRLCQRFWPVPYVKMLNLAILTRDADVREVLHDSAVFGVPYGLEMNDLGDGTTFALGLDGCHHRRQHQILREVMRASQERYERDIERVVRHTRAVAEALLENGAGRIDAMTDYVTRIATETAARYFGISVDDPVAFGEWTLAMSCLLFGDPSGDPATRRLGLNAGTRLRLTIDDSIDRAQRNIDRHHHDNDRDDTILDRLLVLQKARKNGPEADRITNADIRAMLLGMITGFVPTNTLAAGKMLRELLARPAVFAGAVEHARYGRREVVRGILREAARFDSALAPGQWRVARCNAEIATGTRRARRIPKGTVVLVSTMTALRDPERFDQPNTFRSDREKWGDLMFGGGPHHCLGSDMAIEQITEMFMVLLAKEGLHPAPGREGRMEFTGAFPVRLDLLYDDWGATQSMFLIIAPVRQGMSKPAFDAELAILGHGANIDPLVKKAFDETGIVHFVSMSSIESGDGLSLIVELNVDGAIDAAISRVAEKAGSTLRAAFALTDLERGEAVADFMRRHLVKLHSQPWGATGLDYFGTGEFSVRAIDRQEKLAKLAEKILANWLGAKLDKGAPPLWTLTYVRRVLKQDSFHAFVGDSAELMKLARKDKLDSYAIKPSRSRLKLADHTNATYRSALRAFVFSSESLIVILPVFALFAGLGWSLERIVAPPALIHLPAIDWSAPWTWPWWNIEFDGRSFDRTVLGWAGVLGGALLATALVLAAFAGAVALHLLYKERHDLPDQRQASAARIAELGRNEDYPGYAHSHFMAVGDFKPGPFRTLIHAFALWGIKMIIIFYYRPGFVVNMGTIHYARWWRLPGTAKSVFFSNYDGSWDSYLEDFITRARWGQTAAWSNWQGFPKTRLLIFEGAQDGDRFKRWVRTKQQVVPFWYSRFPHLTTDQIRNNALIHHGLARIRTDGEAREWLRCFGSMPRVENLIETDQVQSLVFRGFRGLEHSTCLVCKLPPLSDGNLGGWLDEVEDLVAFGDRQVMGEESGAPDPLAAADVLVQHRPKPVSNGTAMFVALSATGFRKFYGSNRGGHDLPDSFPPAFKLGMAARWRILGDVDDAAPGKWRWSDIEGTGDHTAEVVLMLYADTPRALETIRREQTELLGQYGGEVRTCIDSAVTWPDEEKRRGQDHFGFRDGISQPVIRGTERFAKGVPQRDIVEPGEFILGYKSNQGYLPPSPLVRAEDDFACTLPVPTARELSRFPDFGVEQSGAAPHDFGRNGSYIVIRELHQHVDAFEKFVARKADELVGKAVSTDEGQVAYPHLPKLIGQTPGAEWIKAKLVGRWTDGRPLIGNPVPYDNRRIEAAQDGVPTTIRTSSRYRAELDNDFSYGADDPQGFACPFGAHIRRANPRDSKQPGDANEQVITNRHRLLRRGRSYDRGDNDKGLLFVALCADLERQFEFVQQTWVDSPAFHGLTDEPDPLVGSGTAIAGGPACFTIPTPSGPVKLSGMERFVKPLAGGYFFLPSRSALTFLKQLSQKSSRELEI